MQREATTSGDTPPDEQSRKRKIDRACDFCRKRKSRCDGDKISRRPCSNCTLNNASCTYQDTIKRQVFSKAYVETLERRIETLERRNKELEDLLGVHQIAATGNGEVDDRPSSSTTNATIQHTIKSIVSQEQLRNMACAMLRLGTQGHEPDYGVTEGTEQDALEYNPQDDELSTRMQNVHITRSVFDRFLGNKFLGKSSSANLLLKLISLKRIANEPYRIPTTFLEGRRAEYWTARPWELALFSTDPAHYTFPDDDLMNSLIDLYFDNGLRDLQHHSDHHFGSVALLYSDDPRVLSEEYGRDKLSRGWKWFSQVEKARKTVFGGPNLLEIQSYCHIWTRIGVAIRYIQDVGAHRRMRQRNPTITDELWIRAACLAIRYPMDVDDEYWHDASNPERSWRQPKGKPSNVSCFIAQMKLSRIVEMAVRTLYGTNKYGSLAEAWGEQGWDRDIVQELDSALNKWLDDIPEFLRWNPEEPDHRVLKQAAYLHCSYRQTQILIHRPFITAAKKSPQPSLPSLTICTTAAKACAHVLDRQRQVTGSGSFYISFAAAISAIVLLVGMWTRAKPRASREQLRELSDIQLILDYMKSMEDRSATAGRTWDVLNELRSIGETPDSLLGKRPRDGVDGISLEDPWPLPASRQESSGLAHTSASDPPPISSMGGTDEAPSTLANDVNASGMSSWFSATASGPGGSANDATFDPLASWSFESTGPLSDQDVAPLYGMPTDGAPHGLDQDSMAIWSSLPPAFDPNDWLTYLAGLEEAANEPFMGGPTPYADPDVPQGSQSGYSI
ncbi:uncharacterized protein SCHCODRAFT_0255964 [Schizophyllum commune H4-8]|uniref:Zn(2)-C6 fungal-type domain-containing protein n=1 Tax=Schizophyllum commune (strain H4-8 / FGSC 9210) TaxID=578458 RepID=D8PVQ3_SCHCM|nr:uncharacterized protein SCHCODRAFT_0255964 [Schizophyllum commune H4-8]KAI5900259.1 hypothetical protein SCHCODRAFT_0255964 [Schizophyllum commune H4-8]